MKAQINIDSWVKILPCDFGFLVRNVYNFFSKVLAMEVRVAPLCARVYHHKCIEYQPTKLYPKKYLRQLPAN